MAAISSKHSSDEKKIFIESEEGSVLIKINPKIYPLPIIYQAADVFIDKHYIFLDGDPEKEVQVIIKPKIPGKDLSKIAGDFNNELLNYSAYFVRAASNKSVREMILKRAFFSVFEGAHSESENCAKENKFDEKLAEKGKIDIGMKIPIYGDPNKNYGCGAEEKKKTETIENIEKTDSSGESDDEFDLEEIVKPWENQKGKITKPFGE
jgi:His-Xaa-Ser system protein HxsD